MTQTLDVDPTILAELEAALDHRPPCEALECVETPAEAAWFALFEHVNNECVRHVWFFLCDQHMKFHERPEAQSRHVHCGGPLRLLSKTNLAS